MPNKYDIYNPTPARRVIYDGIGNHRRLEIMPGQTLEGVELADAIAARLNKSQGAAHSGRPVELVLTLSADQGDTAAVTATSAAATAVEDDEDEEEEDEDEVEEVKAAPPAPKPGHPVHPVHPPHGKPATKAGKSQKGGRR